MKRFVARYYCPRLADEPLVKVGITVGKPRRITYPLAGTVPALAPYGRLFQMEDPDEFFPAYVERLEKHGVAQLGETLASISQAHGDGDLVLLCYEDCRYDKDGLLQDWCHRLVFAAWWYEQTGGAVLDVEHLRQGYDQPLTLEALRQVIAAPRQPRLW